MSEDMSEKVTGDEQFLESIAYHEAGHAVIAEAVGIGCEGISAGLDYGRSDIMGALHGMGRIFVENGGWQKQMELLSPTQRHEALTSRALVNTAGVIAQRIYEAISGIALPSDLEYEGVEDEGLDDYEGITIRSRIVHPEWSDHEIESLYEESHYQCIPMVCERWSHIVKLSELLIASDPHFLDKDDIRSVVWDAPLTTPPELVHKIMNSSMWRKRNQTEEVTE